LKKKKKILNKNQDLKKSSTLEKVLFLGKNYRINLFLLDISKLLDSNHFIVLNHVSKNGLSVKLKILVDSEVNKSVFINTSYTINMAKYIQTSIVPLDSDCCIWGYDG